MATNFKVPVTKRKLLVNDHQYLTIVITIFGNVINRWLLVSNHMIAK